MRHREALRRGFTYFAQGEDGGPIKIGHTQNSPYGRLDALQTGSSVRLVLVGVLADASYEDTFHEAFAADRLHGEWFEPTDELLAAIRDEEEKQRDLLEVRPFRCDRFNVIVDDWAARLKAASDDDVWALWAQAKEALAAAAAAHLSDAEDDVYDAALARLARLV